MRVCVIGTVGYWRCLAHIGHHVICVDNNEKSEVNEGWATPILSHLGNYAVCESWLLEFTTDICRTHGEILFIAVGTPPYPPVRVTRATKPSPWNWCASGGYKLIVNKSTVPIGSGDWVRMIVLDGIVERQKVLVPIGGNNDEAGEGS